VPEYTAGLFAQYNHSTGLFVRGEANFLGKTYFDEANEYSQDAYMVVNSKLGYKSGYVAVACYANNILNEEYYNYRVNAGAADDFAIVGASRTLGIEVSMQ
jgi:iron complex outermembrane recepter protein